MSQNLYYQGKCSRNIALNAHYYVLFKNLRDVNQIKTLGRQIDVPDLENAYKKATSKDYGYLVVDLRPNSQDEYRIRTDVFGDYPKVYK